MRRAFLDHQASTPLLPEAIEAMIPYFADDFGSPSSLHQLGLRARDALAIARSRFAAFINAESPEDIIFTSGGTEAANLAVKGVACAQQRRGNHIVVSAIDHPSVVNSVGFLEKQGFTSARAPVDAEGFVSPDSVRAAVTEKTVLICVHHVNHDVGTIQAIREIGEIAVGRGIPLFVDATTSGGWLPIDVRAVGIDLLSLSPHRFHGPKGVGILYRHPRVRLAGIIHGGIQEGGFRAGTENVPAIVGAGVAAEIAARELHQRAGHTAALQKQLWRGLKSKVEYIKLNGPEPGGHRISTNLNVSVEFLESEQLALALDAHGVAVAAGPSCVNKSPRISPVLAALGLDHSLAGGSVILSPGKDTTCEEIDFAVETFATTVTRLRRLSPMWDEFQRGRVDSLIAPRAVAKSRL